MPNAGRPPFSWPLWEAAGFRNAVLRRNADVSGLRAEAGGVQVGKPGAHLVNRVGSEHVRIARNRLIVTCAV